MNTPTPEEINRVLDDQLFRLKERWGNEYVCLKRFCGSRETKPVWYVAAGGRDSPNFATVQEAVEWHFTKAKENLNGEKVRLQERLALIEAELAAQKEKA